MKNLMRMGKEDFLEGCFGEYPFFRWPNRCDRCPHRKECIKYAKIQQLIQALKECVCDV